MPKYETTLVSSETVAEGTMAFHFARPAGFDFKAATSFSSGTEISMILRGMSL